MIKGVNKTIIEVNLTEHSVFERAILFVKPEKTDTNEKSLQKQADEYVSVMELGTGKPKIARRPHRKASYWLLAVARLLVAAGVGAGVTLLIL